MIEQVFTLIAGFIVTSCICFKTGKGDWTMFEVAVIILLLLILGK